MSDDIQADLFGPSRRLRAGLAADDRRAAHQSEIPPSPPPFLKHITLLDKLAMWWLRRSWRLYSQHPVDPYYLPRIDLECGKIYVIGPGVVKPFGLAVQATEEPASD